MPSSERPADNRASLVRVAAAGRICPARAPIGLAGAGEVLLPGHGGIALGVHSGDPVERWLGDHLMPGVSIEEADAPAAGPGPLHLLACIGNEVRAPGGERLGVIAGKRGGLAPSAGGNLLSVEAPDEIAATLLPGMSVVVETLGRGLALGGWPGVAVLNTSPRLLDVLPLAVSDDRLTVTVRAVVPATAAGPGLGVDPWVGDLEIADQDSADLPADLSYGDLLAFADLDGRVSRYYRPGHHAIGVVSHGPSPTPGHGVGVTLLLSGSSQHLAIVLDGEATVGHHLRAWAEQQ